MKTEQLQPALAAPPAAVSGLVVLGIPLDTWVLILTAIYTVLALAALIRDKYWKHYMNKQKEGADG
jgi:hypothetical protein